MEVLLIVLAIIVAAVVLYVIYLFTRIFLGGVLRLIFALLPLVLFIGAGLIIDIKGNGKLGNALVVLGIAIGVPWVWHVWGKPTCQCPIHRILDFLDRIANP